MIDVMGDCSKFLLISEAAALLQKGMFAQKNLPNTVVEARKKLGHPARVGSWRKKAAKRARTAALLGKLKVYVTYDPECQTFEIVSPDILSLIIPARSALPDHPTQIKRPRDRSIDPESLRLQRGTLLILKSEFESWYRAEKAKRKWPSQENSLRRSPGRPPVSPCWRNHYSLSRRR
jgi:hypothetical protein